jgi:hypothetical protein
MRREHTAVAEAMYPYFQDVYDHVLRVTEATDSLRDLVSTIVETNLSLRDYRQNLIMKKVTSWAAIVAVPTLITGYYGMNIPFPGFGSALGGDHLRRVARHLLCGALHHVQAQGLALTEVSARGHANVRTTHAARRRRPRRTRARVLRRRASRR